MVGPPLLIPKTRTVNLGGQRSRKQTFAGELETQSVADVRWMIQALTAAETEKQIKIGNPPTVVEIDNTTNKALEAVQKKSVVLYGALLAGAAMRMAEVELRKNIMRATTPRSGRLSDIAGSWQWRYIPKGGSPRVISTAGQLPAFASGDRLVLVPVNVPHATIVNTIIAQSGKIKFRGKQKVYKPGKPGSLSAIIRSRRKKSKPILGMGFLNATTRTLRGRSEFKQFAVMVDYTKAHQVAGEVMTHTLGTGIITIRPRYRRR